VAELADAQDLKSWVAQAACGFDSRPRHQSPREFGNLHDLDRDERGAAGSERRRRDLGTNSQDPFRRRDLRAVFGRRVRELRKARGFSQEELAHRAGIHWTYLGGIERGERNPALVNIVRIARALKVPVAELFLWPRGVRTEKD
jgi:DNA-binding XRE family transcriptional regulator